MDNTPVWGGVLFFLLITLTALGVYVWLRLSAKTRRQKKMRPLAEHLGFDYAAQDDSFLKRSPLFERLARGRDRHAEHVLHGTYDGIPVALFDLTRFAEFGRGNKDDFIVNSVILMELKHALPIIRIIPDRLSPLVYLQEAPLNTEKTVDPFAKRLRFDELRKFSRKFIVLSDDDSAARALCQPHVAEYLLQQALKGDRLGMIEMGRNVLMWRGTVRQPPRILEDRLRFLTEFARLLPQEPAMPQAAREQEGVLPD